MVSVTIPVDYCHAVCGELVLVVVSLMDTRPGKLMTWLMIDSTSESKLQLELVSLVPLGPDQYSPLFRLAS